MRALASATMHGGKQLDCKPNYHSGGREWKQGGWLRGRWLAQWVSSSQGSTVAASADRDVTVKTTDGGSQYAQKRDDQCDPNRRDWAPEAMVQGSGRSRETCPTEVRHLSMAPIPDPMRREAFASGSASDLRSLVPLLLVTWLIDDLTLDNRMVRPTGSSSIQRGRHL